MSKLPHHQLGLVIELDGGYHAIQHQKEYDSLRTIQIEGLHIQVIRFTNEEIEN